MKKFIIFKIIIGVIAMLAYSGCGEVEPEPGNKVNPNPEPPADSVATVDMEYFRWLQHSFPEEECKAITPYSVGDRRIFVSEDNDTLKLEVVEVTFKHDALMPENEYDGPCDCEDETVERKVNCETNKGELRLKYNVIGRQQISFSCVFYVGEDVTYGAAVDVFNDRTIEENHSPDHKRPYECANQIFIEFLQEDLDTIYINKNKADAAVFCPVLKNKVGYVKFTIDGSDYHLVGNGME